uniref:Uncharacterized protein n=1 Tax=Timema douglasi TaxID=61478 RepID=A0A7R8VK78_TIMDO|nr:unnamed protein product [Timema douglasi]
MSKTPRPKIEVLRLPSNERAKLLPLLEGGIQMQAEYKHHRSGDYASYSSLEEATNKRVFRYQRHNAPKRKPHLRDCAPLATKSCDNIFARHRVCEVGVAESDNPFTWRDTTRSEEHLYHTSTQMQPQASPHSTKSRLSALLKKLSPRPRRLNSKTPATPSTFPWVMVEFSNKEVKKDELDVKHSTRCNSEDSSVSDKSFALTVSANKLRKEQALAKKNENSRKKQQPLHHLLRSLITPPRILIASPSPETSRVRMALQSYQNLLMWLHGIRSHPYVED